ncbi:hypothetical protein C8J57DRAFT_1336807 [Mycena rebaudengoi]|nr:hypothetical protein C8J57DRAFT_1336807 [Mycena rebaudengoi]
MENIIHSFVLLTIIYPFGLSKPVFDDEDSLRPRRKTLAPEGERSSVPRYIPLLRSTMVLGGMSTVIYITQDLGMVYGTPLLLLNGMPLHRGISVS